MQVFEPYANLWTIAAAFNRDSPNWMFGPFTQLDGDTIESNVTAWWKFAWKAEKTFEGKVQNDFLVASNIQPVISVVVVKNWNSEFGSFDINSFVHACRKIEHNLVNSGFDLLCLLIYYTPEISAHLVS